MLDDQSKQVFREEAADLLGELETTLLEMDKTPRDAGLINRVFRALHTIKGSGSMFGFEDIADFTHEVETVFMQVRDGALAVTPALIGLLFRTRDHVQKLLDAAQGGPPADPEAMAAILVELNTLASAKAEPAAPSPAPSPAQASVPAPAASEPAPAAPPGLNTLRIRLKPKSKDVPASFTIAPLLAEIGNLGQCQTVANAQGVPELNDLDPKLLYLWWDVTLTTGAAEDQVRDVFYFTDADLDVQFVAGPAAGEAPPAEPFLTPDTHLPEPAEEETPPKKLGEILVEEGHIKPEDLREALSRQKPIGEILAESGKVPRAVIDQAVAKQAEEKEEQAAKKQKEAAQSIRVAAEKLDQLVNLVGELVIVQAQISQVVGARADPTLTTLSEQLERLSDELRDSTLGIRMLPMGTTFSKFRRLVRDLSSELGKEIKLNTQGAETELDKTVIERLGDPLVHLLRNSIDHGIETPEERRAAGKPAEGTILLSAEHSGGEVLIRIDDDGKGIDAEAVRRKAVEKGLIAADADLPERDIYKLIFEPGFSTAKKVTNVSGRGVGMDVVKRAIEALRGNIEIHSEKDKGTSIIVRLPLTLAIIEGLQVQVGDECFVIPLSLVEECVELDWRASEGSEGKQLLHLRGELVPYIHLRRWFAIDGERPVLEQVVITGVEGRRMGVAVDHVIGEHQTVIKTLGRVYKDVQGVSGATIKGDGTIALILDVPGLVRSVLAQVA
jgi:two-component system chemotaxis sensor kinase CheA